MDVMGQDDESGGGSLTDDMDDCGFSMEVGILADVDAAMEEAALCLQHTESYARFIRHTVNEVNKAREIRYNAEQEERRMEQERQEWATGMSSGIKEADMVPYKPLEILPAHTQLHEVMAEVGGYYSGIERCLLLASMQRAFGPSHADPLFYSSLGMKSHTPLVGSHAMKTLLVEACLYSARRGTQRAFATGQTGTALAVANFCSDCLGGVLMDFMSRRAEEMGVARLKPGEGLLEGSTGIFNNASNLIRQGTNVGSSVVGQNKVDEITRRQRIRQGIAQACATLNDLEVAVRHTKQLAGFLLDAIDKGFPSNSHDTEQLRMCVKSLGPVSQSFLMTSNRAMNSLVLILTPRVRSIVGDALGLEAATTSSFMSSSVMGKGMDRTTVRMNYHLDEESYQTQQLGEGYVGTVHQGGGLATYPLYHNWGTANLYDQGTFNDAGQWTGPLLESLLANTTHNVVNNMWSSNTINAYLPDQHHQQQAFVMGHMPHQHQQKQPQDGFTRNMSLQWPVAAFQSPEPPQDTVITSESYQQQIIAAIATCVSQFEQEYTLRPKRKYSDDS